uniref:Histone acetyltransferase n=1 Tax=Panagrellus redivivus TaxID=6233 RepID=A0A7E4UZ83_PANRE
MSIFSEDEFNRRDPTHPASYELDLAAHQHELISQDDLFRKYIRDPALMSIMKETISSEKKAHTRTARPRKIHIGGVVSEYEYYGSFPGKVSHVETVFVCDYCLEALPSLIDLNRHEEHCNQITPPGRMIYRDPTRDFEVRECCGFRDNNFVTRLCHVAKCFIDSKTLQDNLEPFNFYVLYEIIDDRRHLIGCFSKQKYSVSEVNLNCFMTLPAYRGKGYGFFMAEFSFLLSDVENAPGLPETPLSEKASKLYYKVVKTKVIEYIFDYCIKYADTYPYIDNKFSINQMASDTGIHSRLIRHVMETEKFIEVDNNNIDKITIDMCDMCIHHQQMQEANQRILVYREHLNYSQPYHHDIHKSHHLRDEEEEVNAREANMKPEVTFVIKKGLTAKQFNDLIKQGYGKSYSFAFVHKSELTEVPKLAPKKKKKGDGKRGGKKMKRLDFAL